MPISCSCRTSNREICSPSSWNISAARAWLELSSAPRCLSSLPAAPTCLSHASPPVPSLACWFTPNRTSRSRVELERRMIGKIPVVVIVGGGFGGLAAAKGLRRAPVNVLLVDRSNHHVFQPLLYQVATSVLAPAQIAYPLRGLLADQENTSV